MGVWFSVYVLLVVGVESWVLWGGRGDFLGLFVGVWGIWFIGVGVWSLPGRLFVGVGLVGLVVFGLFLIVMYGLWWVGV